MVVKITSPHSIKRVLNYNEKKVEKGQAECIHAVNYLLTPGQMNFYDKLNRFENLIALNDRSKKSNTLHISLNFDPTEKLSKERLIEISETYMQKIGFGMQPYLVYQHNDAAHPHFHIVTTNIQHDGKRIDTYNIGRNQSENARKEIEQDYRLVKAEGKTRLQTQEIIPIDVQRVQYGKSETKRAITNILDHVVNSYKYTSLAELNAILRQYNMVADRGRQDGRIYKTNGLLYKLLDKNGNKIGVPIKASLIHSNPILSNLEKKFAANETKREPDKQRLKTAIIWTLAKSPQTLQQFISLLKKEKVQTVLRQNAQGLTYGITFIDYRSRSVFNGSSLGKEFSIAALQKSVAASSSSTSLTKQTRSISPPNEKEPGLTKHKDYDNHSSRQDSITQLTQAEQNFNRVPFELLKKRKKKRKTGSN